jgi:hypothetical protein
MTTNTQTPICPHCGHEYTHDDILQNYLVDIYGIAHAEGTAVIECQICDTDFWVKGGWTPKFSTAVAEELL